MTGAKILELETLDPYLRDHLEAQRHYENAYAYKSKAQNLLEKAERLRKLRENIRSKNRYHELKASQLSELSSLSYLEERRQEEENLKAFRNLQQIQKFSGSSKRDRCGDLTYDEIKKSLLSRKQRRGIAIEDDPNIPSYEFESNQPKTPQDTKLVQIHNGISMIQIFQDKNENQSVGSSLDDYFEQNKQTIRNEGVSNQLQRESDESKKDEFSIGSKSSLSTLSKPNNLDTRSLRTANSVVEPPTISQERSKHDYVSSLFEEDVNSQKHMINAPYIILERMPTSQITPIPIKNSENAIHLRKRTRNEAYCSTSEQIKESESLVSGLSQPSTMAANPSCSTHFNDFEWLLEKQVPFQAKPSISAYGIQLRSQEISTHAPPNMEIISNLLMQLSIVREGKEIMTPKLFKMELAILKAILCREESITALKYITKEIDLYYAKYKETMRECLHFDNKTFIYLFQAGIDDNICLRFEEYTKKTRKEIPNDHEIYNSVKVAENIRLFIKNEQKQIIKIINDIRGATLDVFLTMAKWNQFLTSRIKTNTKNKNGATSSFDSNYIVWQGVPYFCKMKNDFDFLKTSLCMKDWLSISDDVLISEELEIKEGVSDALVLPFLFFKDKFLKEEERKHLISSSLENKYKRRISIDRNIENYKVKEISAIKLKEEKEAAEREKERLAYYSKNYSSPPPSTITSTRRSKSGSKSFSTLESESREGPALEQSSEISIASTVSEASGNSNQKQRKSTSRRRSSTKEQRLEEIQCTLRKWETEKILNEIYLVNQPTLLPLNHFLPFESNLKPEELEIFAHASVKLDLAEIYVKELTKHKLNVIGENEEGNVSSRNENEIKEEESSKLSCIKFADYINVEELRSKQSFKYDKYKEPLGLIGVPISKESEWLKDLISEDRFETKDYALNASGNMKSAKKKGLPPLKISKRQIDLIKSRSLDDSDTTTEKRLEEYRRQKEKIDNLEKELRKREEEGHNSSEFRIILSSEIIRAIQVLQNFFRKVLAREQLFIRRRRKRLAAALETIGKKNEENGLRRIDPKNRKEEEKGGGESILHPGVKLKEIITEHKSNAFIFPLQLLPSPTRNKVIERNQTKDGEESSKPEIEVREINEKIDHTRKMCSETLVKASSIVDNMRVLEQNSHKKTKLTDLPSHWPTPKLKAIKKKDERKSPKRTLSGKLSSDNQSLSSKSTLTKKKRGPLALPVHGLKAILAG